jgi:dTDP-4-amino-4,6-dideoxygalactose transaminase
MVSTPALYGGTPVRESPLVFGQPKVSHAEVEEVVATLRSGWWGTGPRTQRFEEELASYVGAKHAVGLTSGTAALQLALVMLGIGPGDEVITAPMTFAATANVILHAGATPVFADIDPATHNIDPTAIERAVTPRTKAVIPVHLAGVPCDMDAIQDIARRHSLHVIEDAAHALGARYHGRPVGSLSELAAFSFSVTKTLVTGDGGMLTTDSHEFAERARLLRLHGLSKHAARRFENARFMLYDTLEPGFKCNMTDITAALGLHQLPHLEDQLARRRELFGHYDAALSAFEELERPPRTPDNVDQSWTYYRLLVRPELGIDRDELLQALQAEGIGAAVHFTSLHLHEYYRERFGLRPEDFPVAADVSRRTISLPLSHHLSDDDAEQVREAVAKIVRYCRERRSVATAQEVPA